MDEVKGRKRLQIAALIAMLAMLGIAGFATAPASGARQSHAAQASCSSGYVDAIIGGQEKCLRNGEFCSAQYETDYERYGFSCVGGHLTGHSAPGSGKPVTHAVSVGRTIRLAPQSQHRHCTLGVLPDRQCSPGAYSSGLSTAVLCSSGFRTSAIRNVPESEKHTVEVEYGLVPRAYGRSLEIDHIVSLELGGSNDLANLYPERAPGYRAKDKLENRLHQMVCDGRITLRQAQAQIASDWVALYRRVFGHFS
jgi:hypothetical protein